MNAPTNKADYYRRWHAGEFGNRPRAWNDWPSLRDSDYHGLVTIRNRNPGSLLCYYGVPADDLRTAAWPWRGGPPKDSQFNETMPDDQLAIQGNVWLGPMLRLEYSCEPGLRHREAVSQPHMKTAEGLAALFLLKQHLDPNSYDDLQELLERFPEAVIEFSAYRTPVGVLEHRRTVFWEIRNY